MVGTKRLFRFLSLIFFLMVFLLSAVSWAKSEEGVSTHIELILDASGSMWSKLENTTRIEAAREALGSIVDDLAARKGIAVGLRVYGHRTNDCKDTKLEIPIGPLDGGKMKAFIAGIKPKGKTPIAYSLLEGAKDFDPAFEGSKVIILVTDGLESCNGDPCAAAKELADKGVVSKIHVVGFGLDKKSMSQLACIPKPSGGLLLEAGNAVELSKAFDEIVKSVLDSNLEVKGVDSKGKGVSIDVTVMKDGDPVLEASGETVRENLPEGNYLVRAVAAATGEEILFEGVDLLPDKLTSLKAVFSSGIIRIRGTDGTGKGITVSCEIFAADSEEALDSFICSDWEMKALLPGSYRAKVGASDSGVATVIEFEIKDGEKLDREVSFAQGKLILDAKDSKGKAVYIDSWVYKAPYDKDSPEEADRDGGTGEVPFTLVPGTYDILVRESNTSTEQWLKGVVVEGGKTIRKELSFAQGKLILNAVDSKGKPLYVDSWVYKTPYDKDSPEEVDRNCGTGEVPFTLVPGTYDILVQEGNTSTQQWLKGVIVEGGKTLRKEVLFAQGTVRLKAKGFDGRPLYFYVDVYASPAEENEEVLHTDSGEGEFAFQIVPGKYDLKIRVDQTPAVLWEKDVEVTAGGKVEKTFDFPAARVRIATPKKGNKRELIYVKAFLSPSEENEDAVATDSGEDEYVQFFLVPGTYDLLIITDDDREMEIKGVELAANDKFMKEAVFGE